MRITMQRMLAWMFAILPFLASSQEKTPGKGWNVVLFLVDDLGWMDLSSSGSRFYETPNIDRLRSEGVYFSDAYSTCHVCSPSRASLMTGKYPARVGVTDWLTGRKDQPFQRLAQSKTLQALPSDELTLAERLRQDAYRTAIIGKWHLGDNSPASEHGFDLQLPRWNKGWPVTYHSPFKLEGLEGPDGEYLTDRLTDEALRFIGSDTSRPFFLFMSHYAVHDPIEGKPALVEKYRRKLASMPKDAEPPPFVLEENPDTAHAFTAEEKARLIGKSEYGGYSLLPNRMVKIKQRQDNAEFAAMVESMDESLGRLMDGLRKMGLYERTIIVFTSDNGGMSGANFGNPTRKVQEKNIDKAFSTSNLPLRGAKGWMYEGGIRVPLIIKAPSAAGIRTRSVHEPVSGIDIYPTVLDLLAMPLMPAQHVDGSSLKPLLADGRPLKRESLFWYFPHYSNHGLQPPGAAMRQGRMKLIEYFENGTVQLFDLSRDIGERKDLSHTRRKTVERMHRRLEEWKRSLGLEPLKPNPGYVAGAAGR